MTSLHIELNPSYADNPGKYSATIKHEGERGSVELILEPDASEALLLCCGQVITEFSHKACLALEANIKQSVLEAQKAPAIEETTA